MIDNYMYDIKRDEYFTIGTDLEEYFYTSWNDGEPLWTTASKQVWPLPFFHWRSERMRRNETVARALKISLNGVLSELDFGAFDVTIKCNTINKSKFFSYSLPSVGPGADPGVQAVSPQVT